jgi:transcriptional regulator with XRE-family HTH domain
METIEQRVIFLRKKVLRLTQTEFAERMGLKQSVISQWEVGITPLNEKNIKLICHIFKVDENWLRHGTGEVFTKKNEPILHEIMELVERMDEPEQEMVLNYVRWYVSQQALLAAESPPAPADSHKSLPPGDFTEERSAG